MARKTAKTAGLSHCRFRAYSAEFARFVQITRASEIDVMNHLLDAQIRRVIETNEYDDADHAARKALKALNGLSDSSNQRPTFGR
jgi:hypothetical protein